MRPQSPDDHPATGPHHLRNAFGSALIFTAHAVAQTSAPRLRTLYNFTGGSDGRDPGTVVIGSGGVGPAGWQFGEVKRCDTSYDDISSC
jgi:hypothetical protein